MNPVPNRRPENMVSGILGSLKTIPIAGAVIGVGVAIGVGLLALTIYSGLAGVQSPQANFAPTFIYAGGGTYSV